MANKLGQSRPSEPVDETPGSVDLAIVVLNFDTALLLRACLQSVYANRLGRSFHVCVVDNASGDDSVAMVRSEFPQTQLIVNARNMGYPAGNNAGLRWFGFADPGEPSARQTPRYALLLNPDTVLPPDALAKMVAFMDENPAAGMAGPRVRRPDGSLDRACRRSFPTPNVSLYRMTGLSRLFPKSRRFNAYNLEYMAEDAVHEVDSVVGAFMLVRGEAIRQVGLLDETFFMYGEDLDWAKRIKDAGWRNWYNGAVEITHVKEAASRGNVKARIDFYEAMWIFYRKHYQAQTGWLIDKFIRLGISLKGGLDIGLHLWRYCSGRKTARNELLGGSRGAPARPAVNLPDV